MKKILFYTGVLLLFGLGPVGFIGSLGTSVSLKYEVDHPRATTTDPTELKELDDLEKQYTFAQYACVTLTVLGPANAIFLLIRKNRRTLGTAERNVSNGKAPNTR